MLRLVEYGLLAVSLLTVLGLILAGPADGHTDPQEEGTPEIGQVGSH
jgi:hypothetical protein